MSAYVAIPPSTRCSGATPSRYLDVGRAIGGFGGVALLDVSPRPCVLTGRLTLNGQNSARNSRESIFSPNFSDRFMLSPDADAKKAAAADRWR